MKSKGTVLIAGGSLAGLMLGGMLNREGWRVRIFERVAGGIESRGAGIATHEDVLNAFARAGAEANGDIGIKLVERVAYNRNDEQVLVSPVGLRLSAWGELYRRLRPAVPPSSYILGMDVVGIGATRDDVTFHFANGSRESGDLAIGADGIWSKVRADLHDAATPQFCGYIAWRGIVSEGQLPERLNRRFEARDSFFAEVGQQFAIYPMAGADESLEPGQRRFGFIWYRSADERELSRLLEDVDGNTHPTSISPAKIKPQCIAEMKAIALAELPESFAEIVQRTRAPFIQPIFDMIPGQLVSDRTALIGDAAAVARPHVGAGVKKAAGDALSLANALLDEKSIREALLRYQGERLAFAQDMVARSRQLGQYLEYKNVRSGTARLLTPAEILTLSGRG